MEVCFLTNLADAGDLPTEFRIFKAGLNDSTKGPVWFDARAAQLVMAAFEEHAVDHIIDLEHYSIIPRSVDPDATDTDARGWYRAERRGGELWAAGVTWTEDGSARLRGRRQRYMSPAFYAEFDPALNGGKGGKRVVRLVNVALCSQPASYQIDALVRTLDHTRKTGYGPVLMTDRECLEAVMAALAAGDVAGAQSAIEAQLAAPPAPQPGTELTTDPEKPPADPEKPPMPEEYTAIRTALCAAAGVDDADGQGPARAISLFGQLLADRKAAADAELRSLVGRLIELGAETPATAWSNGAAVPRLAAEPLESLRARVTALSARPGAPQPTAPVVATGGAEGLSEIERRRAAELPEGPQRDRFIAARQARREARAAG